MLFARHQRDTVGVENHKNLDDSQQRQTQGNRNYTSTSGRLIIGGCTPPAADDRHLWREVWSKSMIRRRPFPISLFPSRSCPLITVAKNQRNRKARKFVRKRLSIITWARIEFVRQTPFGKGVEKSQGFLPCRWYWNDSTVKICAPHVYAKVRLRFFSVRRKLLVESDRQLGARVARGVVLICEMVMMILDLRLPDVRWHLENAIFFSCGFYNIFSDLNACKSNFIHTWLYTKI